jgi:chemotaxis methyl-accepting protein methylase
MVDSMSAWIVPLAFKRPSVTPLDYEYLRKYLKDHSGLVLSADKQYLIESRLLPLARKAGLPGIGELVQTMRGGSALFRTQVVEAMTTNETFFFRDKIPFDYFRDKPRSTYSTGLPGWSSRMAF